MTELQNIGDTWVNLSTLSGLTIDNTYTVQNIGNELLYIYEAVTTPSTDERGVVLDKFKSALLKQDATLQIWIRSRSNNTTLVITESD